MNMSPQQIEHERRRGRLVGAAAIAAALSFAAGALWYLDIAGDAPDNNSPALLRFFDRHSGELIAASLLQAIGMLLVAVCALYLYRAIRDRRPEESQVVQVMAIYGPVAFALSTVGRAIALSVLSADFTGREFQSIGAADDVFESPVLIASSIVGFSGVIALGFWFVKACLDAMRVGLLGRFMGWTGVLIGPALVFFGFGDRLMPVWLFVLGLMLLGLWPRGLPPAWREGRAIPWAIGDPPQGNDPRNLTPGT
jgi:Domain of unknown function (DUF4386)